LTVNPPRFYHIAQYNIARMIAPLEDPRIADFVAALDPINRLGDESPGFVWRHQTPEGNSTSVRVRGDPYILINFSVWESIDALFQYTYRTAHADVFRRRREWFEEHADAYHVLWWIPAGHEPSVEEGEARLDHLIAHGPTPRAFGFKNRFPPPDA
jgi:hypothetical protein